MINNPIELKWNAHDLELIQCKRCPRLVQWREEVARVKRKAYRTDEYWGKPIPAFGDHHARVMVVGLAPGAHGSNRTGRMFTGDASGDFLYPALFRAGFANQATAVNKADGLCLQDLLITAICRCAPPENKPEKEEMINCRPYLLNEIDLIKPQGFVALGKVAFENILSVYSDIYGMNMRNEIKFFHNAFYRFEQQIPWLVASYHPSRQNTQTGKLIAKMFDDIWLRVREKISNE